MIESTWEQLSHLMPNELQATTAIYLPAHNIDFGSEWDTYVQLADEMIADEELLPIEGDQVVYDQYSIRGVAIAAMSQLPIYPIRLSSDKDGWYSFARKFIYETYADCEVIIIPALRDEVSNAITDYHNFGTEVIEENWHEHANTKTYSPKWLRGKTLYERSFDCAYPLLTKIM